MKNPLLNDLLLNLRDEGLLPEDPSVNNSCIPTPLVNSVELYLSFHGNDCCSHCLTFSGPHREEVLSPEDAYKILLSLREHSLIKRIKGEKGFKELRFYRSPEKCALDNREKPPESFSRDLVSLYADCLQGVGDITVIEKKTASCQLRKSRPTIRLSGGEFYLWPHRIDDRETTEEERAGCQRLLLETIRYLLPEYDIWILTNGRFAESRECAERTVRNWLDFSEYRTRRNQTRICLSVDCFHQPPRGRTRRDMLRYIWKAARKYSDTAPYIYGIPDYKVFLTGRALENFDYRPQKYGTTAANPCPAETDPTFLTDTDGCREVKGFLYAEGSRCIPVNNIVIDPLGNLCYCCACVGNYGSFLHYPEQSLRRVLTDPVSRLIRKGNTAEVFLNRAVELDPEIKIFGNSPREKAAGSTCYQVLSGFRPGKSKFQEANYA